MTVWEREIAIQGWSQKKLQELTRHAMLIVFLRYNHLQVVLAHLTFPPHIFTFFILFLSH